MMRAQYSISALAILLVIQAINCTTQNLANYSVINFLQDVRRLHHYDQLVFVHNRNATMTSAFGANTGDLKGGQDLIFNSTNILVKPGSLYEEARFVQDLMTELKVPVVLMNELSTFVLKQHFSTDLMIVFYMDDSLASHIKLLRATVAVLKQRTLSNILFLINSEVGKVQCGGLYLRKLFEFCWLNKMINVVAICSDYQLSGQFYSYTNFPKFALEYKPFDSQLLNEGPIYPYRLGDMHGYNISYIIGGSTPRIIVYDWNGRKRVGGIAGHFISNFARKHNCKLYEPLPSPSNSLFAPAKDLIAAVRNNTVDISIGLSHPSLTLDGFTYPYEQLNWCIWMPVEADIPHYDFIWIVFEDYTFHLTLAAIVIMSFVLSMTLRWYGIKLDISRFIIHDACLRGVMGQSFRELPGAPFLVRFIYIQIYVLGFLLTISYNSYFATYWTSAPKVSPLRTFDDLLYSKSRVYVFAPEYDELIFGYKYWRKYAAMFEIESDFQTYLNMRETFNTKYMFVIPTTKWFIFREQQKIFTKPIFRMRHDLCIHNNILMGFPVHENSIFKEQLYIMMLQVSQSGLKNYWRTMGFWELVRSGRLPLVDLSRKKEFRPMMYGDMQIVWIGITIALVLAFFVFLMELIYFKRERLYVILKGKRLRTLGKQ